MKDVQFPAQRPSPANLSFCLFSLHLTRFAILVANEQNVQFQRISAKTCPYFVFTVVSLF